MKNTNAQLVKIWMQQAGQVQNVNVTSEASSDLQKFQLDLVDEEFNELLDAFWEDDRIHIIKECLDLIWVTYGLLHLLGVDVDEAFGRLYASNQSKLPFTYKNGKVQKGPNYVPPFLKDL
tara:strand:+ start:55 stop:414 length:360 start_codon:yes stop_codon:yes gene_type:complete